MEPFFLILEISFNYSLITVIKGRKIIKHTRQADSVRMEIGEVKRI